MPFSVEEKRRLFDDIKGLTVSVAEIKTELKYGSREFTNIKKRQSDFDETKNSLTLHLDRHLTFRKVMGWVIAIGGLAAGLWRAFRGS